MKSLGKFVVRYQELTVAHPELGYEMVVKVPSKAKHRPALKAAFRGRYYEPFSHLNFKKILDYSPRKSVVHAGTFYGDMLHTYAQSANRVYAFEPVLENYVLAKLNAEDQGLTNVTLTNCALSNEDGTVLMKTIERGGRFAGGASSITTEPAEASERVACYRMDSLPLADIGLIQLDVEGHERIALEGGVETIRTFEPIILIEDNKKDCDALLQDLGYRHCFTDGGLSYWGLDRDVTFLNSLNTRT